MVVTMWFDITEVSISGKWLCIIDSATKIISFNSSNLVKYLDAKVVAGLLPVHLAVCDVEEVLDANFVSRRNLKKRHSSGNVLVLSNPVG